MNGSILGWDVGGANIKAACLRDSNQADAEIIERPFALWREPQRLPTILNEIHDRLGRAQTMGITMTAELADCFATKREGVGFVLDAFRTAFPDVDPWVFGTDGQFRSVAEARNRPEDVAAANWVASAMLVARSFPQALFLDVGSTTTDIIPIVGGRVAARGRTDTARLLSGELVYTGALRTPVAAIVRWVTLSVGRCRVAAEHFAVAADVHLWLGHIDQSDYTCDTPDGRGRDRDDAAARLARMVCADRETLGDADITAIADHASRTQVRQIAAGLRQVARGLGVPRPRLAVISGHGSFLARFAAQETGLAIHDLAGDVGSAAARAVPAAAVARLLMDAGDGGVLRQ
ncbi:MAG: H4MPT-linked C1 transfer pathway protein [Acidobacteria bacterium]|nr:MAG: H4MPT-linked C1 transfer pathway protein [Acidobacteriota bacterium]